LERRVELALVAAYDDKNAMLKEDVKKRDRTISQLNGENKRLKGIVESVRNTVNH